MSTHIRGGGACAMIGVMTGIGGGAKTTGAEMYHLNQKFKGNQNSIRGGARRTGGGGAEMYAELFVSIS